MAGDFLAAFFGGYTAMLADIREKVVEEPTYGRALSPSQGNASGRRMTKTVSSWTVFTASTVMEVSTDELSDKT